MIARDGKLLDRIELPKDRTIAGFDANSVYLIGRDPSGTWLERVRIK